MVTELSKFAATSIQNLSPYTPGKPIAELKRELGIERVIKLASNENPLGPSPKAVSAAKAALSDLARYPDGSAYDLKQALAHHLNVAPEQLTLGNGSDAVFTFLGQVYVQPGDEIIASQHAFAAYKIAAATLQAKFIETPADNYGYDLNAIKKAITDKTRIIFIANPNNPTGTWHTESALSTFLRDVPCNVIVVLDEAYFEYMQDVEGYPDSLRLQQQFTNVVITRTFSKAYGLAGLRIGYGISHPIVADLLNRVRLPFNVSTPAQAAAIAALEDPSHVATSLSINQQGSQQLQQALKAIGLEHLPVFGNFITIDLKQNADTIFKKLLAQGVIVRPIANHGLPSMLRVSIGTKEENDIFINELKKVLNL